MILEVAYSVEPPVYYIFASVFMSDDYPLPCFIGKVVGNDFSVLTNFVKPIKCICILGTFYYEYYLRTKYLRMS